MGRVALEAHRSPRGPLAAALLGVATLGLDCAPAVTVRLNPPPALRPARVIAVGPFALGWEVDPDEPVKLGDRLALRLAQRQGYALFGPTDLGLGPTSPLTLPLPAGGPVSRRIPDLDAKAVLVVRGSAEWHLGEVEEESKKAGPAPSAGAMPPMRGRGRGLAPGAGPAPSGNGNTYACHVELVDAAGGVLAEVDSAPDSSADVGPEIDRLADRLLDVLPQVAPSTQPPRQPWWEGESLTVAGPRVESPSPAAAAAGLRAGDVVLDIGPEAASALGVQRGLFLAPAGGTVAVRIRRAGTEMVLNLPAGN